MSNRFVPHNPTAIPDGTIVIDFSLYRDDKCELDKMSKTGTVKKILRIIKNIGQCQDASELHELLKAHNSCDMKKSKYQSYVPEDMIIYEVWHEKGCAERVFYTRAGNTFYPVIFLNTH